MSEPLLLLIGLCALLFTALAWAVRKIEANALNAADERLRRELADHQAWLDTVGHGPQLVRTLAQLCACGHQRAQHLRYTSADELCTGSAGTCQCRGFHAERKEEHRGPTDKHLHGHHR